MESSPTSSIIKDDTHGRFGQKVTEWRDEVISRIFSVVLDESSHDVNKDFCEREREREFFKSPALSYIYIYTTRPKRKKKNSERTRDYSCPDLSTVHYLSSRRLAGWDLCSETQTLFHLPAGRHLILCDVGITPIVFFLSFFLSSKHTHTKDASWRWFLFLLFKQIAVVLLNCWAAGRNESLGPPRLFLADGQKRKKNSARTGLVLSLAAKDNVGQSSL